MRLRFLACAAILILGGTLISSAARADTAPSAPSESSSRRLLQTGGLLFGAGYAPVLGAGLPSTGGVIVRVFLNVFTVGLYQWGCRSSEYDGDGRTIGVHTRDTYLCSGEHGGIQLLVPFAGPFLFAANHPQDSILNPHGARLSGVSQGLLYASGAAQIAGGLLVGIAIGDGALRKPKAPPSPPPGVRFRILPAMTPSSVELQASIAGW